MLTLTNPDKQLHRASKMVRNVEEETSVAGTNRKVPRACHLRGGSARFAAVDRGHPGPLLYQHPEAMEATGKFNSFQVPLIQSQVGASLFVFRFDTGRMHS